LQGTGLGVFTALVSALALASDRARAEDPWPFWGRTATRLGNTTTIGPQTPTIAWRVRIDPTDYPYGPNEVSPVMDAHGRIFAGHPFGITAVDSTTREVLWEFDEACGIQWGPCVWNGRVMFGDGIYEVFYCLDAATGHEVWREEDRFVIASPVAAPNGVVYFPSGAGAVCARWIEDGSEFWTTYIDPSSYCSCSLDWPRLLTSGSGWGDVTGLDPLTGETRWTFPTGREVFGVTPIVGGVVYIGSWDTYLYCVDARTGTEIWRFPALRGIRGAVAVGPDGTIYVGTTSYGRLFAVSPDGEELWRYELPGLVSNAPIVGGDGTVYVCSSRANPYRGWVHALRPDGTLLWTRQMPDAVHASPMLAPDGTLYVVCKDKYLYAFHDPALKSDPTGQAQPTQVRPVPPP
jgi:outer membrane protein assembly factor BamB